MNIIEISMWLSNESITNYGEFMLIGNNIPAYYSSAPLAISSDYVFKHTNRDIMFRIGDRSDFAWKGNEETGSYEPEESAKLKYERLGFSEKKELKLVLDQIFNTFKFID